MSKMISKMYLSEYAICSCCCYALLPDWSTRLSTPDPRPSTLCGAIASFRRNVTQRVSRQGLLQQVFSADNITTILHQQLRQLGQGARVPRIASDLVVSTARGRRGKQSASLRLVREKNGCSKAACQRGGGGGKREVRGVPCMCACLPASQARGHDLRALPDDPPRLLLPHGDLPSRISRGLTLEFLNNPARDLHSTPRGYRVEGEQATARNGLGFKVQGLGAQWWWILNLGFRI